MNKQNLVTKGDLLKNNRKLTYRIEHDLFKHILSTQPYYVSNSSLLHLILSQQETEHTDYVNLDNKIDSNNSKIDSVNSKVDSVIGLVGKNTRLLQSEINDNQKYLRSINRKVGKQGELYKLISGLIRWIKKSI